MRKEMDTGCHRGDRIGRIEDRITALGERATELLRREHTATRRLEDLRRVSDDRTARSVRPSPSPSPRRRRRRRSGERARARAEHELARLRARRQELVQGELRSIMLALEQQSRRTRDRLDRELERLRPVEEEWDGLRGAFKTLGATIATPAIEELAGQWRGALEIPEFPVHEQEGYAKPFPHGALLF
jgi:hypothetical protein